MVTSPYHLINQSLESVLYRLSYTKDNENDPEYITIILDTNQYHTAIIQERTLLS